MAEFDLFRRGDIVKVFLKSYGENPLKSWNVNFDREVVLATVFKDNYKNVLDKSTGDTVKVILKRVFVIINEGQNKGHLRVLGIDNVEKISS